MLGDNTGGGALAAVDRVPGVLELGFQLVSLVHIFDYICPQFTLAWTRKI